MTVLEATGYVGIGTTAPDGLLHLQEQNDDSNPIMRFERGPGGQTWAFHENGNDFHIRDVTNATDFLQISDAIGFVGLCTAPAHPLHLASGVHATTAEFWTDASSRAFKERISDLRTEDAVDALRNLRPKRYFYKRQPGEEYVGFIAEDVPDLVTTDNRESLAPMDIVAVLTKVSRRKTKPSHSRKRPLTS